MTFESRSLCFLCAASMAWGCPTSPPDYVSCEPNGTTTSVQESEWPAGLSEALPSYEFEVTGTWIGHFTCDGATSPATITIMIPAPIDIDIMRGECDFLGQGDATVDVSGWDRGNYRRSVVALVAYADGRESHPVVLAGRLTPLEQSASEYGPLFTLKYDGPNLFAGTVEFGAELQGTKCTVVLERP